MAGVGKIKYNFSGLLDFHKKMNRLKQAEIDLFLEVCAKELAARLLAKVIKRTPTGDYDKPVQFTTSGGEAVSFTPHTGKKGGTLKRGWTAGKRQAVTSYVQSLTINQFGGTFVIEIVNPVEYAPYVEFGHRTSNHKGWVPGKFMMTLPVQELQEAAPAILQRKLEKKLGEWFK